MNCSVCEMPLLMAPGFGWYCPDLQCDWHDGFEEHEQKTVTEYEEKRRKRDGQAYVGMSKEAWLKLLAPCQADCQQVEALWRAIRRTQAL